MDRSYRVGSGEDRLRASCTTAALVTRRLPPVPFFARSSALPNPCNEDMSVEEWLVLGFGEFVYFAMPALASPLIERLDEPYAHFCHVRYGNIMLIPPNMPVYANGGNAFVSTRKA